MSLHVCFVFSKVMQIWSLVCNLLLLACVLSRVFESFWLFALRILLCSYYISVSKRHFQYRYLQCVLILDNFLIVFLVLKNVLTFVFSNNFVTIIFFFPRVREGGPFLLVLTGEVFCSIWFVLCFMFVRRTIIIM
jgi:hypothetical protein